MDNNNINMNPEIVPDAPDAVVPEINEIPQINSMDELTAAAEAPIVEVAPVVEAPIVEAPVVEAPIVEAPVVEAFPDGSAPVVYATGSDAQPTNAPYYAAADNYTQKSAKGEGLALTSFILGLCSLVLTWDTPLCFICVAVAIAGIIFAVFAKKKGAVNSMQKSGLTMAIIGLVLSLITSVSCTACYACADGMSELASSEIFSELGEGDFEALEQFVQQYGSEEDVQQFNEALEQLQGYGIGE